MRNLLKTLTLIASLLIFATVIPVPPARAEMEPENCVEKHGYSADGTNNGTDPLMFCVRFDGTHVWGDVRRPPGIRLGDTLFWSEEYNELLDQFHYQPEGGTWRLEIVRRTPDGWTRYMETLEDAAEILAITDYFPVLSDGTDVQTLETPRVPAIPDTAQYCLRYVHWDMRFESDGNAVWADMACISDFDITPPLN